MSCGRGKGGSAPAPPLGTTSAMMTWPKQNSSARQRTPQPGSPLLQWVLEGYRAVLSVGLLASAGEHYLPACECSYGGHRLHCRWQWRCAPAGKCATSEWPTTRWTVGRMVHRTLTRIRLHELEFTCVAPTMCVLKHPMRPSHACHCASDPFFLTLRKTAAR